jgi:hypothetical protein
MASRAFRGSSDRGSVQNVHILTSRTGRDCHWAGRRRIVAAAGLTGENGWGRARICCRSDVVATATPKDSFGIEPQGTDATAGRPHRAPWTQPGAFGVARRRARYSLARWPGRFPWCPPGRVARPDTPYSRTSLARHAAGRSRRAPAERTPWCRRDAARLRYRTSASRLIGRGSGGSARLARISRHVPEVGEHPLFELGFFGGVSDLLRDGLHQAGEVLE